MTAPAVTAVVPTHNRPELMKRAVESIAGQDYDGPLEIVVVFDACDVELPDIELRHGRTIRGINNSRSRGLAGARNTGILAAGTDYVAFLDDDDFWLQGKLEAQMELLRGQPEAVLVGTAMVVDAGERTHERLMSSDVISHAELIQNGLAGLHSSSLLFRRQRLLGDLGLVDEQLPRSYGEDYDLLLRASALHPVAVVNRPLVSVTWKGQSFFFGQWAVYAEALQYLLTKHPDFASNRKAIGRIQSQVAFALAASDQKTDARAWAVKALRNNPRQVKAALALAITTGLVTAPQVIRVVRRFGKGI
ncbi:glycosyltransferase involved in cell wall biosynthesis [Mycetocola sp. CAN_C7]|uniref:glycosyltransferase family 2 protein n=1 Tax=Mycetocola sp. CAN_C7 TaxID=2787724 RepID=UPI0018CB747C